ncbi:MAG: hypothetical protein R3D03_07545 [Geminicoccaceae bacterium]
MSGSTYRPVAAISIEQKTTSRNLLTLRPRSPKIYDYDGLLWARVGIPYSPATGLPIEAQTVRQMVDRVMAMPDGTRLYSLAPTCAAARASKCKEMAEPMRRGFQRVKVDGEMYELDEAPALDKEEETRDRGGGDRRHGSDAGAAAGGIDRDSAEPADALAITEDADSGERVTMSAKFDRPHRASPCRRSNRGCSRSTIPMAPVRPATASASGC